MSERIEFVRGGGGGSRIRSKGHMSRDLIHLLTLASDGEGLFTGQPVDLVLCTTCQTHHHYRENLCKNSRDCARNTQARKFAHQPSDSPAPFARVQCHTFWPHEIFDITLLTRKVHVRLSLEVDKKEQVPLPHACSSSFFIVRIHRTPSSGCVRVGASENGYMCLCVHACKFGSACPLCVSKGITIKTASMRCRSFRRKEGCTLG